MPLSEEKRNQIKKYILEQIKYNNVNIAKKTALNFNISIQTAYRYISQLVNEGAVKKIENGKYELIRLVNKKYKYDLSSKEDIQEDIVFRETLAPFIKKFNKNTYTIWEYSFTEMVNNVIDHSEAKNLEIYIGQDALNTWVNIIDDGIGIFKKISEYYHYNDLEDAMVSLFKGKLTTDNENHSGEGIFFTSRVMDWFGAISSNKLFLQEHTHESVRDLGDGSYSKKIESFKNSKGTVIVMVLTNDTNRTLKEVFDMYSSVDGGFTITNIPMKRICDSGYPVSRSQAKRLYFGFEKFEKVILDFNGVDEIGQGFAHELFNVFQKKHPEIKMECINTNDAINKMIAHVQKGM